MVLAALPATMTASVAKLLDDRGHQAQHVTVEQVTAILQTGLANVMQKMQSMHQAAAAPAAPPPAKLSLRQALPSDYRLPDGTTLVAWTSWMCGDGARNLPPLRWAGGMMPRAQQRAYCEMKAVCSRIEAVAKKRGLPATASTPEEALKLYEQLVEEAVWALLPPETVPRAPLLRWRTVAAKMRVPHAAAAAAAAAPAAAAAAPAAAAAAPVAAAAAH